MKQKKNSNSGRSGVAVDALVRKSIIRRWRTVSRHKMVHDDGSFAIATDRGWFLHCPDGVTAHGPFQYGDDAKNFHIANAGGIARELAAQDSETTTDING